MLNALEINARKTIKNYVCDATTYFMTITLDPFYTKGRKNNAHVQFKRTKPLLKRILNDYYYVGVIELTKKSNIHYHLLISIPNNESKLCLLNWLKIIGLVDCQPLKYPDECKQYMCKDLSTTANIMFCTLFIRSHSETLMGPLARSEILPEGGTPESPRYAIYLDKIFD